MASLHKDKRTGCWRVMFRYDGKQYCRSCKTKHQGRARAIQSRVGEKIRLLELGDLSMPADSDPAIWLMSDGRKRAKPVHSPQQKCQLSNVCEAYLKDQVHKADTTLGSERQHIRHLKRVLRESTPIVCLGRAEMKHYVQTRSNQKHHNKPISGTTIRKELVTFKQIWRWARHNGHVKTPCPIYDEDGRWCISLPKPAERIKFQTWAQIERRIARGGLTDDEIKLQWRSLFLDGSQVVELLKHVKDNALHEFIYPMYAFCAYTGARRSEILRSRIDDFDFEEGTVLIRERKRRRHLEQSTRQIPLHPYLGRVMQEWFEKHPGGSYTITTPLKMPYQKPKTDYLPLTYWEASHHFKHVLKKSKWSVIRGFHILRHSFGSNLARSGKVQTAVIGKWMGHSTQEMMEYYQHLFPQDGASKIELLNYK